VTLYAGLFPYQCIGVDFLAERKRAFLFDDMGLGKSAQAIRAADKLYALRILVICPAVARVNWQREFTKFGTIARSTQIVTGKRDLIGDANVIIINYELLDAHRAALRNEKFDVCIIDEGQYLKNPDSKRTQAAYGAEGVAISIPHVWVLTGTPAPNNNAELFPHLRALVPTSLRHWSLPTDFAQFQKAVCVCIDTVYGLKVVGNRSDAVAVLKKVLEPIMLRRRSRDVLKDLPAIRYETIALPAAVAHNELALAENDPEIAAVIKVLGAAGRGEDIDAAGEEHIGRLRRLTGVAKAHATLNLLMAELGNDTLDKVVVFAHHRSVLETLYAGLAAFSPVMIHGDTSPLARQDAIDNFQTRPGQRVFLGQLDACSITITLTAACQVVFAEWSWTPTTNEQAAKRCHRIGQTRPVLARFVSLAGSIDEIVTEVVRRKTRLVAELLD
jgi:SWI/SNF-related matrix-associated actin-dependent regulator 1 of chromatin subfamily A